MDIGTGHIEVPNDKAKFGLPLRNRRTLHHTACPLWEGAASRIPQFTMPSGQKIFSFVQVFSCCPSAFSSSLLSSEVLCLRRAFLDLLAFFFLLISSFSAVLLSGPFSASSSLSASSRRAMDRFWDRERVACDFTTMPVGKCFSCTADDVLF